MTSSATMASGTGWRWTKRAHCGQRPSSLGSCGPSASSRRRSFLDSAFIPIMPRKAGISVIAASATTSTVTEAAMATPLRNETPRISRPSSATITVAPANRTARPEVLSARTHASSGSRPFLIALRCRVTTNSE